jgi:hypothetical protein
MTWCEEVRGRLFHDLYPSSFPNTHASPPSTLLPFFTTHLPLPLYLLLLSVPRPFFLVKQFSFLPSSLVESHRVETACRLLSEGIEGEEGVTVIGGVWRGRCRRCRTSRKGEENTSPTPLSTEECFLPSSESTGWNAREGGGRRCEGPPQPRADLFFDVFRLPLSSFLLPHPTFALSTYPRTLDSSTSQPWPAPSCVLFSFPSIPPASLSTTLASASNL